MNSLRGVIPAGSSGQFLIVSVNLIGIERVEVNILKPQIAACRFYVVPKGRPIDCSICEKPVAAVVGAIG